MKRIITSACMMLSAFFANANHQSSELLLSSRNNDYISVTVDHRMVLQPDRDVEISGLTAGEHFISVRKISFRPGQAHQRLLYNGTICIPSESRITAVLDRNCLTIESVEPICVVTPTWTPDPAPVFQPAAVVCGPVAMDAYSFDRLKSSIACKTFESTKLVVAQQAASGNFFTSCQVAELLSLFTFESTKIEFAKCAYSRTVDKQMYFLVNDAFTFSSSVDELNAFIFRS
jgi:hypothetical protein